MSGGERGDAAPWAKPPGTEARTGTTRTGTSDGAATSLRAEGQSQRAPHPNGAGKGKALPAFRMAALSPGRGQPRCSVPDAAPIIGPVPRTDTSSRMIPAPISDVYAALERFEPRPGGAYRMVLRYPDHSRSQGKTTSDTDVVEARFIDLVPNKMVVYSVDFVSDDPDYSGAMTMRWEVADTDGGISSRSSQ